MQKRSLVEQIEEVIVNLVAESLAVNRQITNELVQVLSEYPVIKIVGQRLRQLTFIAFNVGPL